MLTSLIVFYGHVEETKKQTLQKSSSVKSHCLFLIVHFKQAK